MNITIFFTTHNYPSHRCWQLMIVSYLKAKKKYTMFFSWRSLCLSTLSYWKKIPYATQNCEDLSQEFSHKAKLVWPDLANPPSRKHILRYCCSRICKQHKIFLIPFMSFFLSTCALHYINQTWLLSLKKSFGHNELPDVGTASRDTTTGDKYSKKAALLCHRKEAN